MIAHNAPLEPSPSPLAESRCSALLDPFTAAGVIDPGDAAIARRLAELGAESDPLVILAAALCVRAVRAGSVCIAPATIAQSTFVRDERTLDVSTLPWPDPQTWRDAIVASPLVTQGPLERGARPLRYVSGLLYLERYWNHEEYVRQAIVERLARADESSPEAQAILDEFFPGTGLAPGEPDRQREGAERATRAALTIIAGGPGTGKTSTVARLLATAVDLAAAQGRRRPHIGLAAPTGKAAVRIEESLRAELEHLPSRFADLASLRATTVHRMLGWLPSSGSRFSHDAANPLPFDLVVVDEASMVSLALMRRLLEALRPDARLVLVGDPDQLTPVEAGAVLADVVRAPGGPAAAVELTHNWRFGSAIADLADGIRRGDADQVVAVLERDNGDAVRFLPLDPAEATPAQLSGVHEEVVSAGRAMVAAARAGDAREAVRALDQHRLLCAHRFGGYGVARWAAQAQTWIAQEVPRFGADEWSLGHPLLVGRNQPDLGLFNGDAGVVVATGSGPRAAFLRGDRIVTFAPAQIADASALFAMTVHKSQGSQFGAVTVVLPPPSSPLLTRELLYTAVTRAQHRVTLLGTPESVRAAVERPVIRASGLRERLGAAPNE